MRGNDRQVTIGFLNFPEEVFKSFPESRTFRKPQRETLTHPCGEGEKFHFLSNLAMIPLLCLFHHSEIFIKKGFLRETDTVDSREHLTFLVTAPVGTGNCREFHCFDY